MDSAAAGKDCAAAGKDCAAIRSCLAQRIVDSILPGSVLSLYDEARR